MKVVSAQEPLHHYQWGNDCDGWNLVDTPSLSVKKERMPAGTAEEWHYHEKAQQFFFILEGEARFEVEDNVFVVKRQQGLNIPAGKKHRICNQTKEAIEFILSSQPSTKGDRYPLTP